MWNMFDANLQQRCRHATKYLQMGARGQIYINLGVLVQTTFGTTLETSSLLPPKKHNPEPIFTTLQKNKARVAEGL